MITIQDIQASVTAKLTQNKCSVTASEVTQGFTKPTYFIEVLPVTIEVINKDIELVTVRVELTYHPAIETREELLRISETLRNIFLYESIAVNDRFLSTDEIVFDTDKTALTAYFELSYMQETNIITTELPKMEKLQTEVKNNGSTANTDTI